MDNEEKHILDLLKKGSSEGFRKTALLYGPLIFALAMDITGNKEEAEEITSDSLMKAFRAIQSFRPDKGSLKSWILRIAHNAAVSSLRRRQPELLDGDIPDIPVEPEEESDDIQLLNEAIERCSPKDKALLHMYYYDRLSLSEIASAMEVASTTLAVRLQRIRQKLKQYIISHHGR